MYSSMIHYRSLVLCAHLPVKSPFITPHWTLLTVHNPSRCPSPPVTSLCCLCLWVFVLFVHLLFCCISHICVKSHGSWLFLSDRFDLACYSQDPAFFVWCLLNNPSNWAQVSSAANPRECSSFWLPGHILYCFCCVAAFFLSYLILLRMSVIVTLYVVPDDSIM